MSGAPSSRRGPEAIAATCGSRARRAFPPKRAWPAPSEAEKGDRPGWTLGHDAQAQCVRPFAKVVHGPLAEVLADMVDDAGYRPPPQKEPEPALDEAEVRHADDQVAIGCRCRREDHGLCVREGARSRPATVTASWGPGIDTSGVGKVQGDRLDPPITRNRERRLGYICPYHPQAGHLLTQTGQEAAVAAAEVEHRPAGLHEFGDEQGAAGAVVVISGSRSRRLRQYAS